MGQPLTFEPKCFHFLLNSGMRGMIRLIIEGFDFFFGERYPNQTNFPTLERGLLKSKRRGTCQDHTRFPLHFNAQFDTLLSIIRSQEPRGVIIDQDQFIVKLNSGSNTCLIKVSQGMGG